MNKQKEESEYPNLRQILYKEFKTNKNYFGKRKCCKINEDTIYLFF